jgi:hypothetical protein
LHIYRLCQDDHQSLVMYLPWSHKVYIFKCWDTFIPLVVTNKIRFEKVVTRNGSFILRSNNNLLQCNSGKNISEVSEISKIIYSRIINNNSWNSECRFEVLLIKKILSSLELWCWTQVSICQFSKHGTCS